LTCWIAGGLGWPGTGAAQEWRPVGLLRIRDLTPFSILRLDMIPAHAVTPEPGSWAIEANLEYQNTLVISTNVRNYLKARNRREPLSRQDVDAILAFKDDAYFIDTELGLLDLGFHYTADPHWEAGLTLPVLHYGGGFLDSTIESFHDATGFSNLDRSLVARNRSQYVFRVGDVRLGGTRPPRSNGLGDPVLSARWALYPHPGRWNLIVEGAAKIPVGGERPFLSNGRTDLGLNATLQRFFRRQAVYLEVNEVYSDGMGGEPDPRYQLVTTLLAGYEFRITGRTNGILQLYAGESGIQSTTIKELRDEKYQLSLGLQSWRGDTLYRLALTENVAHYDNTPDLAILLSAAHRFAPRRRGGARHDRRRPGVPRRPRLPASALGDHAGRDQAGSGLQPRLHPPLGRRPPGPRGARRDAAERHATNARGEHEHWEDDFIDFD
jgi:hypothetical protein